MNRQNVGCVLGSLLSISAFALEPSFSWQGPYAGIYLGGGFGNSYAYTDAGSVNSTSYFTSAADITAVNRAGGWQKEPKAMIAGIQVGHDWIWKQIIYGLALDYGSLALSSSALVNKTYPNDTAQYSVATSMSTDWLFSLRGKLGYQQLFNCPGFLYLTGGMAMTQLKASNNFSDNSPLAGAGGNQLAQNQVGWTVGAGIEVAVWNHTSINLEYQYIDIPSVKTTGSIFNTQGGFGIPEQSRISSFSTIENFYANLFKLGINYRFDE